MARNVSIAMCKSKLGAEFKQARDNHYIHVSCQWLGAYMGFTCHEVL